MRHSVTVYLDAKRAYNVIIPHPGLSRASVAQTIAARRRVRAVESQAERDSVAERSRLNRLIEELDTEKARRKRPKSEVPSAPEASAKGMTLREQAAARAAAREKDAEKTTARKDVDAKKQRSTAETKKGTPAEADKGRASASGKASEKDSKTKASAFAVSVGSTSRQSSRSLRGPGIAAAVVAGILVLLLLAFFLRVPLPGPLERIADGVRGDAPTPTPLDTDSPEPVDPDSTADPAVMPETRVRDGEDSAMGDDADPTDGDGDAGSDNARDGDATGDRGGPTTGDGDLGVDATTDAVAEGIESNNLTATINDIIVWTNAIAAENDYRTLGQPKGEIPGLGPDPDWIFPGSNFVLPDGDVHVVEPGDTLWGIATDYIEHQVAVDFAKYLRLTSRYQSEEVDGVTRERIVGELSELQRQSPSERFRAFIQEQIRGLEV